MKTLISTLAAGVGLFMITGCESSVAQAEIPSVVLNAFNLEFEDPKEIEWEKKKNLFIVEFELLNKEHEAMIDENGKLLKFKKELDITEISEELKKTLATGFSENKIDDIHLLVMGDNQYYQVELEGKISDSRKVFNEAGEEMKTVKYFD